MKRDSLAVDTLGEWLATRDLEGIVEAYRYLFEYVLVARQWQIGVVTIYV